MSKSKNTKPEMLIQNQLTTWNIPFHCHAGDLPGTPDLVFRDEKIAVLIHGCFWHQHGNCEISKDLNKMDSIWKMKFVKSSKYDLKVITDLKKLDWKVLILWECEIYADVYSEAEKIIRLKFLNSLNFQAEHT
jgi:DNA mismatch endonuclease (patch repair protein)